MEKRPPLATLQLLYAEIAAELAGQRAFIDQLNQRAQNLFSFVAVILALLATLIPMNPCACEKVVFGAAVPIFGVSAFFSARAWGFRKWRHDPNVGTLWANYRFRDEEVVRHGVIQNRLDAIEENNRQIDAKRRDAKWAQWSLYVGFIYVSALVLYRVVSA